MGELGKGERRLRSSPTTQAHRAQEHLSSGGCSSLVLVHPQPMRQSTTPHWSRVLHHNGGPNQYKPSCLLFFGFVELGFEIVARASLGERDLCAHPSVRTSRVLPEPVIRHLARQIGVRHSFSSVDLRSVTTGAFGRRRPPFVSIACTSCPL